MDRRDFMAVLPALSFLTLPKGKRGLPISCNTYNWVTFYKREGKSWGLNLDEDIRTFASSGLQAIEPNILSVEMGRELIGVLKKYHIAMPSIYVNSVLHKAEEIKTSKATILDIADLVSSYGTRIIVTNPSPIAWGQAILKTDDELRIQAQALDDLGAALRQRGMVLAYHTHDMEMKGGAREFHHMLLTTAPRHMSFCFDLHWVYRGSDNSAVAVMDTLKLYGSRIAELHIRQSRDHIWQESFTPDGDIDYPAVVRELGRQKVYPHLVIEQCVEAKSPHTLDGVTAHKHDLQAVRQTFAPLNK